MYATTVSTEELRLRRELAAVYRLVAHFRMTDLIFTHVSVRLPGPEHHFLINPYGLLFEEITASSLVKIDLSGHAVEDSQHPVNPAGFVIHSAVHAARPDAHCVLHTHTRAGCAVAATPTASCTPTPGRAARSPPSNTACSRSTRSPWSSTAGSATTTTRASPSTSPNSGVWSPTWAATPR